MKITAVRLYRNQLPAVGEYTMSSSTVTTPESIIVEVETDDGTLGFGEACMATPLFQPANAQTIFAALTLLVPPLIGADPTLLGRVHQVMNSTVDGQSEAKAAIDIACWDLLGKSTDRSVSDHQVGDPGN